MFLFKFGQCNRVCVIVSSNSNELWNRFLEPVDYLTKHFLNNLKVLIFHIIQNEFCLIPNVFILAIELQLKRASKVLKNSTALFITSGAGIGYYYYYSYFFNEEFLLWECLTEDNVIQLFCCFQELIQGFRTFEVMMVTLICFVDDLFFFLLSLSFSLFISFRLFVVFSYFLFVRFLASLSTFKTIGNQFCRNGLYFSPHSSFSTIHWTHEFVFLFSSGESFLVLSVRHCLILCFSMFDFHSSFFFKIVNRNWLGLSTVIDWICTDEQHHTGDFKFWNGLVMNVHKVQIHFTISHFLIDFFIPLFCFVRKVVIYFFWNDCIWL